MATNPEEFDFDIGDVTGKKGDTGNGISGIELLSTSGLQKTYRINMTNETHFDFVVTDGNGISGASFDADTNELTITFDNGTSFTTPSLKGNPGDNGYSPAVTIETITGGHRVTITDKDHPTGQSFDVMDGASDAGNVSYDETATYQSGSVGATLQEQTRQISDKADKTNYVTLTGTIITQTGADNTMYLCGELTELTVSAPATGIFGIRFTSGTIPTIVTFTGITMPDDWPATLEASTTYEVNILNGLGVWQSWI